MFQTFCIIVITIGTPRGHIYWVVYMQNVINQSYLFGQIDGEICLGLIRKRKDDSIGIRIGSRNFQKIL